MGFLWKPPAISFTKPSSFRRFTVNSTNCGRILTFAPPDIVGVRFSPQGPCNPIFFRNIRGLWQNHIRLAGATAANSADSLRFGKNSHTGAINSHLTGCSGYRARLSAAEASKKGRPQNRPSHPAGSDHSFARLRAAKVRPQPPPLDQPLPRGARLAHSALRRAGRVSSAVRKAPGLKRSVLRPADRIFKPVVAPEQFFADHKAGGAKDAFCAGLSGGLLVGV